MEAAEGETELDHKERVKGAMRGRFTVSGFRFPTPPAHIDLIDTMFDYIRLVEEKDRHFFNAVIFVKTTGHNNINWMAVRQLTGLDGRNPRNRKFNIATRTIQRRYHRLMQKLTECIKEGKF